MKREIRFGVGSCSLGSVLVEATDEGISSIALGEAADERARELRARMPEAELRSGDPAFEATLGQVIALVDDPQADFDLPLDVQGTAFQRRVWEALRQVPAGTTITYAELARRVGAPTGARAVAGACASNALAVVIPCHRVVRSDGHLSGYRWGVERKRALLEREGARSGGMSTAPRAFRPGARLQGC